MKKALGIIICLCMLVSMVAIAPADFSVKVEATPYNINGGSCTSANFIIDPGHGGDDPGACALGREEAEDVTNLSLAVGRYIIKGGGSVAFTRVTNMSQSLAEKVAQQKRGSFSYFVSIHRNASNGAGYGVETFYYSGGGTSYTLAEAINSRLVSAGGWRNRGLKTKSLYVVNNTSIPACLVEVGFIDNAGDNTIWVNKFEQNACAIANGMLAMIGKSVSMAPSDTTAPTVSNVSISNVGKDGYRVSCTVSDNVGVTRVRFPTWTNYNGQDDLIWHEGTISGSTAYYDVKVSEHNNEYGAYTTHIYAYDAAGNQATGGTGVELVQDSTKPVISNYSVTNVTSFGFDVKFSVSDNVGVTKVQVPTWTESGGQDDIQWYTPSVSGGVATLHVYTKNHSYQSGLYNIHAYAYDLWNNSVCVTMSVTVPSVAYPTDADYIPLTNVNGSQYESASMIWTTGTFTAQYWGVMVLKASGSGWVVSAKYDSGTAKSVAASTTNPIVAVHSALPAYASYAGVQVGAEVTLEGVSVGDAAVIANAHVRIPYTFVLKPDIDDTVLDDKYVTPEGKNFTASQISAKFKCVVTIFSAAGVELGDTESCGTGCVVKCFGSDGVVINSVSVVITGDINGDGDVTSVDLINARSVVKTATTITGAYAEAMDMDGDGNLNTVDYVTIKDLMKSM